MPLSLLPQGGHASAVLISPHSHSHKKCKGISGSPSSVHPLAVCPQLSPQRKMVTANKRVSGQFPLRFSLCLPKDLSSSESPASSSGDDNEMLLGKDTNDKIKTPFVAKGVKAKAIKDRKIVIAACKAKAVGGKKDHSISSAMAKAAKAGFKVDKLRTELAEATKPLQDKILIWQNVLFWRTR